MDDWIKAGKIAAKALEHSKCLVKIGTPLLEAAEKIEDKIISLGGKPAFPVNISINQIAAHYSPFPNDESVFKEGDLVKIDIGAHVNGAIGDTAHTIDLGDNKDLVKASREALNNAIKILKKETTLGEIGTEIQRTISSFGFAPIKNLSGHAITRYNLHTGINIPNYDSGDKRTLEDKQVIAIEPFATTGTGEIIEGKESGIYKLVKKKPIRDMNARKVLVFVEKEYSTLPFAKRWITKKFPAAGFALLRLEKEGILYQFSQLPEKAKGLVSQAEHTVIIGDKIKVTTELD